MHAQGKVQAQKGAEKTLGLYLRLGTETAYDNKTTTETTKSSKLWERGEPDFQS